MLHSKQNINWIPSNNNLRTLLLYIQKYDCVISRTMILFVYRLIEICGVAFLNRPRSEMQFFMTSKRPDQIKTDYKVDGHYFTYLTQFFQRQKFCRYLKNKWVNNFGRSSGQYFFCCYSKVLFKWNKCTYLSEIVWYVRKFNFKVTRKYFHFG